MIKVVAGTHVKEDLITSHRWLNPQRPDPDGVQLATIKAFLNKHKQIKRVWFDEWCMPQGDRTEEEQQSFDMMLANVNMLYLGASVLILLDLSYVSRFWTQFEAWCSMQLPSADGLRPASGTANERFYIECIQNAAEQAPLHKQMLIQSWATKTPIQAHDFLAKPDVTVTNQSDKQRQLKKIQLLDSKVRGAFAEIDRRKKAEEAARVAAQKAAVDQAMAKQAAATASLTQAQLELVAWERENGAVAGEQNRLKMKVRAAERGLDDAKQNLESVKARNAPAHKQKKVANVSSTAMDAFFKKIGSSLEQVKSATELRWSTTGLTYSDCKAIAHVIAGGAMAQLQVTWHLTVLIPCLETWRTRSLGLTVPFDV